MYTAFRLLEKGFFLLALLGLVLRSAFVDGGIEVMLIGLLALAALYFVGGYFQARPPEPNKPTTLPRQKLFAIRIVSGIASSFVVIGVLFKLMFWEGSTIELIVGLVLCVTVQFWAFVAGRGAEELVAVKVFRRTARVTIIGGILLVTPVPTIIRWFHRDNSVLAEKMVFRYRHPNDPTALQAVGEHLAAKRPQL